MGRLFTAWLALVLSLPGLALGAAPAGTDWQRIELSSVTLYHHPNEAVLAGDLAAATPQILDDIERRTGLARPGHVDVIVAASMAEFARVQPGQPPSWAAGTAYDDRGEVYLRAHMPRWGADPIDQVYVHELSHIFLGQAFDAGVEPPRWLNEGLARLMAGELSARDHTTLAQAALAGRIIPMESITDRWPSGAARAHLAYVQSVDFMAYIADQRDGALPALVAGLVGGQGIEQAARAATGRDLKDLEGGWRSRMTFWHALFPVIGGSGATWVFATLLFVVASWKRRRGFHEQVAAMDAQERLEWEAAAVARARAEQQALLAWVQLQEERARSRVDEPPDDDIVWH